MLRREIKQRINFFIQFGTSYRPFIPQVNEVLLSIKCPQIALESSNGSWNFQPYRTQTFHTFSITQLEVLLKNVQEIDQEQEQEQIQKDNLQNQVENQQTNLNSESIDIEIVIKKFSELDKNIKIITKSEMDQMDKLSKQNIEKFKDEFLKFSNQLINNIEESILIRNSIILPNNDKYFFPAFLIRNLLHSCYFFHSFYRFSKQRKVFENKNNNDLRFERIELCNLLIIEFIKLLLIDILNDSAKLNKNGMKYLFLTLKYYPIDNSVNFLKNYFIKFPNKSKIDNRTQTSVLTIMKNENTPIEQVLQFFNESCDKSINQMGILGTCYVKSGNSKEAWKIYENMKDQWGETNQSNFLYLNHIIVFTKDFEIYLNCWNEMLRIINKGNGTSITAIATHDMFRNFHGITKHNIDLLLDIFKQYLNALKNEPVNNLRMFRFFQDTFTDAFFAYYSKYSDEAMEHVKTIIKDVKIVMREKKDYQHRTEISFYNKLMTHGINTWRSPKIMEYIEDEVISKLENESVVFDVVYYRIVLNTYSLYEFTNESKVLSTWFKTIKALDYKMFVKSKDYPGSKLENIGAIDFTALIKALLSNRYTDSDVRLFTEIWRAYIPFSETRSIEGLKERLMKFQNLNIDDSLQKLEKLELSEGGESNNAKLISSALSENEFKYISPHNSQS